MTNDMRPITSHDDEKWTSHILKNCHRMANVMSLNSILYVTNAPFVAKKTFGLHPFSLLVDLNPIILHIDEF